MARALVGIGIVLIVLGVVVWLLERAGVAPGRLPGDINIRSGNVRVFFPVMTCVLLSVVLTALLWFSRALHR